MGQKKVGSEKGSRIKVGPAVPRWGSSISKAAAGGILSLGGWRIEGSIPNLPRFVILFIDELHTVVGAGRAEGAMDAGNLLKPMLARGELHCIGATTLKNYIGFDGLTTLAEEVENPRRNILLATVLTCVITGVWSGSQVFLSQLAWPDWTSFTAGVADEHLIYADVDLGFRNWIASDDDGFPYWCQLADVDYTAVRQKLNDTLTSQRHSPAPTTPLCNRRSV